MENEKVKKATFYMVLVMILVKLLGFFKQFVLAYFYGSSTISDAFMTASDIPTQVFSFLGQAISTSFIPIYCKIKEDKGKLSADKFTSNMITMTALFCAVICFLMVVFADKIVMLFANGFSPETNAMCSVMVRISAFGLLFVMITRILSGYLQVYQRYVVTTIISMPLNIIEITFIALSYKFGYYFLGIGLLLGMLSGAAIVGVASRKIYKYEPFEKIDYSNIKNIILLSLPVILGVGVNQINKIVDKRLASSISEGSVSILGYASIINTSVQDILVTSFITVLFVRVAVSVSQNAIEDVKTNIDRTMLTLVYLLLPTTIGVVILAPQIVKFIFGYGAFDSQSIMATSSALIFYSLGMIFVSGRDLLIRVFYAFGNTKIPMITSIISILVNIILDLLLSRIMGLSGLAMATSISAFVCFVLTYLMLVKKIGKFVYKESVLEIIKMIVATIVLGVAVIATVNNMNGVNGVVQLFSSVVTGMLAYAIMSYLLKIDSFNSLISVIFSKLKKNGEVE